MVAAYLDSPEAMKEKPRAVEVLLKEDIPGLSVPLTGAMDLVEGNFTPVDFKSAAAKPDPAHAAFDHEIQLVSYQLLLEAATGETPPSLDLVFLVKTKTPQIIRVPSPPADAHRKRRVIALLETAVEGIASNRHHPQPGMQCSWCQFRNECMAWLPGQPIRKGGPLESRCSSLIARLSLLAACNPSATRPAPAARSWAPIAATATHRSSASPSSRVAGGHHPSGRITSVSNLTCRSNTMTPVRSTIFARHCPSPPSCASMISSSGFLAAPSALGAAAMFAVCQ